LVPIVSKVDGDKFGNGRLILNNENAGHVLHFTTDSISASVE
jgi:hypothetical protein